MSSVITNETLKECHLLRNTRYGPKDTVVVLANGSGTHVLEHRGKALGSMVWEGARCLSNFLLENKETYVTGKRALELGSGCGLCGFTYALNGGNVVLTDGDDACVQLLRLGLTQNLEAIVKAKGKALVSKLVWGGETPSLCELPFDVILAADCLYSKACVLPLMETLTKHLIQPGNTRTILLLAYRLRDPEESLFFELLKTAGFKVEMIGKKQRDNIYRIQR